jgi:hypothetical protein
VEARIPRRAGGHVQRPEGGGALGAHDNGLTFSVGGHVHPRGALDTDDLWPEGLHCGDEG